MSFNIHARIEQPDSLWGRMGKWFSKEPPVVHLVGTKGVAEVYAKKIGNGQFAANAQQYQEMLKNHDFVPIR